MHDDLRNLPLSAPAAASGRDDERRARRKGRRQIWLDIHLYIGLFAGALLVVIALCGSFLVFWQEIDELLDPQMFTSAPPSEGDSAAQPIARIAAAARAAMPAGAKLNYIGAPRGESGVYKIYYKDPANGDTRRLTVDPYAAKVLGDRLYHSHEGPLRHSLMSFMFELHWSLLMSDLADDGGVVVGILAILLSFSVATGLILWWPSPGKWVRAFIIKPRASAERLTFDIHKVVGLYTSLVLLAVLISGVSMNLPAQFTWVVERISALTPAQRGELRSQPQDERAAISLEEAAAAADRLYPQGRLTTIGLPKDEAGVYEFCRDGVAELSRFVGVRCVFVDQYSGEIIGVRDPATGSVGDLIMQWQWPLHSGQAFGMTGRILVFITGLGCAALYVTGVLRWLHKRRARRAIRGRA